MDWDSGLSYLNRQDVPDYVAMADVAPSIDYHGVTVGYHKLQRFAIPWLAGTVAKTTGVPISTSFCFLALLSALALLFLWNKQISKFKLSIFSYAFFVGLLILNNYFFRYHAIVPGMAQGLIFLAGVSLCLIGLENKKSWTIFAGLLLGSLARQTILLLLPGIMLWVAFEKDWAKKSKRFRLGLLLFFAFFTLGFYILSNIYASQFGIRSANVDHILGVWTWTKEAIAVDPLSTVLLVLLEQTIRAFLPVLIVVIPFLVFVTLNWKYSWNKLNKVKLLSLALSALLMISQPILAGPWNTVNSGSRLGALGLLPALLMLAYVIEEMESKKVFFTTIEKFVLIVALIIYSLHHLYTWVGPSSVQYYFVFQLVSILLVSAVILLKSLQFRTLVLKIER